MDIMQGWFDFIADEIFQHGQVSFNSQGLLRQVPREMLTQECRRRGWELVESAGNGVRGLTICAREGGATSSL
ncbi:MAG: hypothetical protein HY342_13580 [Candidatus Lambdaproteobacteria bacterium]|nr:hypothetical protein [Candidatus Lambdaproteobacteria bacterium]